MTYMSHRGNDFIDSLLSFIIEISDDHRVVKMVNPIGRPDEVGVRGMRTW